MSFLCQKNSYLKELTTAAVISCTKSKLPANIIATTTITINTSTPVKKNGDKEPWIDGYDVVLEDTIFFPEGGGQPYDTGMLDTFNVLHVRRDGDQAILFIGVSTTDSESSGEPFSIGHRPVQRIDWTRRFDHMQQHSAQHLITALAYQHFSLPTTSWCLGKDDAFIEMDTGEISAQTLTQLEVLVNEKIRQRLPVNVSYLENRDSLTDDIRFHRELPSDSTGPIRIITIGGDGGDVDNDQKSEIIDQNPCCGTHVANLADLQAIKLLCTQKRKKGKTQLYFVAGGRVLKYFDHCLKREHQLASMLKCSPEELPTLVDKAQKSIKRLQKNCINTCRELGKYEAERYLATENCPKFFTLHRKEGEYDFITIFINTVGVERIQNDRLLLLSVADDCLVPNSGGQILIAGDELMVKQASEIAQKQFSAKGSIQRGCFRARISDVSKLVKLEEAIRQTIPNLC